MGWVSWEDVGSAVANGLSGSGNPYLSTAGGILGGGGGGGGVVIATPPPPPPVPTTVASTVGAVAPSLPMVVGLIGAVVILGLAFGVRGSR